MTQPLSSRVPSVNVIIPADSDGFTWRAAVVSDAAAISACDKDIAAVDHPQYHSTEEDIAEEFEHSYSDPATDSLVAIGPTGDVEAWGFAIASPVQETLVRSIIFGGVRPRSRGRGLGRTLVAWQHARALQQLASSDSLLPGRVIGYLEDGQHEALRLFERFGFTIGRYYLEFARDLSEPIAAAGELEGLRIVPFATEFSESARLAHNDAFRDHWGSQPLGAEQWQTLTGRSTFRGDLSALAITAEGDVVGYAIVDVNPEHWDGQGFSSAYVDLLGVRRDYRGRGIAQTLLATVLASSATEGVDKVVLDVDSDSPTGAVGLYRGVGFVEAGRSINVLRDF